MQKVWKDYGAITLGTILIGLATKNIFDPANMVTGGVSGVAIIGKELWDLPLWVTNTVLNIPLFLAGFKIMGWKFISVHCMPRYCCQLSFIFCRKACI